jgi:hypothetical protein
MPAQTTDDRAIERAVTVQMIGRVMPATTAELYETVRALSATPSTIEAAVARLIESGVLRRDGDGAVSASDVLRRLDDLGLIGV